MLRVSSLLVITRDRTTCALVSVALKASPRAVACVSSPNPAPHPLTPLVRSAYLRTTTLPHRARHPPARPALIDVVLDVTTNFKPEC